MKEKTQNIINKLFSLFIIIAIFGGGIIFLMFIVALLSGGNIGTKIAISASDIVMPYFIKAAAIAVLFGLISIYSNGTHYLSLKGSNKNIK